MSRAQVRHASGSPEGGRFATAGHPEAEIELTVAELEDDSLDDGADDVSTDQAVDWLLSLRELQAKGMSFDDALAEANRLVDETATISRRIAPPSNEPRLSVDPDVQAGKVFDTVIVFDEETNSSRTFHRSRDGVLPNWPYAMRFQTDRQLTDGEARHVAGLVGYAYRQTVAGEPLGELERDTPYSFVVSADTTKSRRDDLALALADFEMTLPSILRQGSPVRKTDKAGPGTAGTRLVEGMGSDFRTELYYDDAGTFDESGEFCDLDWVGQPERPKGTKLSA